MKRLSILPLATTIFAISSWMSSSSLAKSPVLDRSSSQSDKLSQLYYPPVSDRQGIQVFGQGQVKLPADKARLEFTFVKEAPPIPTPPVPTPSETPTEPEATFPVPPPPKPITREELQAIVDAIAASGIPTKDIQIEIDGSSIIPAGILPLPSGKPKITVAVDKPTKSRMQRIVTAVKDAARSKAKVAVESVNAGYAVKDCQKLTTAAYQAAVNDARLRAEAIASSLKVKLKPVPTVSESFFYDIAIPLCVTETGESFSLPLGYGDFRLLPSYNPDAPAEVRLRRDLFVTYPVEN